MHDNRPNASIALLTVVVVLRLIDKFDHTASYLRHLTFHRRPAVVLELGYLNSVLHFAIGNVELAAGVIRTAFAVHVLDEDVIVMDFIIRPVAGTFFWCIADL